MLACALYVAIKPKYGNIALRTIEKPLYSNFQSGTIIAAFLVGIMPCYDSVDFH